MVMGLGCMVALLEKAFGSKVRQIGHGPRYATCTNKRRPNQGAFLRLALALVATRYKTLYWWLHGGYMTHQRKKPTTVLILSFSMPVRAFLVAWGGLQKMSAPVRGIKPLKKVTAIITAALF